MSNGNDTPGIAGELVGQVSNGLAQNASDSPDQAGEQGDVLTPRYDLKQSVNHTRKLRLEIKQEARSGAKIDVWLRQAQEGEVHLLMGYREFGDYASGELGMSPSVARKRSQQGRVLLLLEQATRIRLMSGNYADFVGTEGRRALSAIEGTYGVKMMLAVYDKAVEVGPKGKPISALTINKSVDLLAQEQEAALPQQAAAEIAPPVAPVEPADEDEEDDLAEPEEAHVVYDSWNRVLDFMRDLRANVMDKRLRLHALQQLKEELAELEAAVLALDAHEVDAEAQR